MRLGISILFLKALNVFARCSGGSRGIRGIFLVRRMVPADLEGGGSRAKKYTATPTAKQDLLLPLKVL